MLERFWRGLKRREIYADASTKWRNPQAELPPGAIRDPDATEDDEI